MTGKIEMNVHVSVPYMDCKLTKLAYNAKSFALAGVSKYSNPD